jgi:hypothetical protein
VRRDAMLQPRTEIFETVGSVIDCFPATTVTILQLRRGAAKGIVRLP